MIRRPYVKRCYECRRKKRKCGGEEPQCQRCLDSRHECPGYQKPGLDIVLVGPPKARAPGSKRSPPDRNATTASQKNDASSSPGEQDEDASKDGTAVRAEQEKHDREGQDPSALTVRSNHQAVYDQPDTTKIEAIATMSFLRDMWLAETDVNLVKHPSRSRKDPSTLPVYIDGWHKYVFTAADAVDGSMINHCLNAAGSGLMGGLSTDLTWIRKSQQHYHQSLQSLRATSSRLLKKPNPRDRDLCLLTCLSCSLCASAMKLSIETISSHMYGIEAIIRHEGVDSLDTAASREVYMDYRALNMSISLLAYKALWPFTPPIQTPSWWSDFGPARSPVQQLLDAVSGLPALQARFLPLMLQQPPGIHATDALEILSAAGQYLTSLDSWLLTFRDTPSFPTPERILAATWLLPHLSLAEQPFPFTYHYASFKGAIAQAFVHQISIAILELLISAIAYLDPGLRAPGNRALVAAYRERSLRLADSICMSIEYFVAPEQGLAGRLTIISPFPMAMRAYENARLALSMNPSASASASASANPPDMAGAASEGAHPPTHDDVIGGSSGAGNGPDGQGDRGQMGEAVVDPAAEPWGVKPELERLGDCLAWCAMAERKVNDWFPDWNADTINVWFTRKG